MRVRTHTHTHTCSKFYVWIIWLLLVWLQSKRSRAGSQRTQQQTVCDGLGWCVYLIAGAWISISCMCSAVCMPFKSDITHTHAGGAVQCSRSGVCVWARALDGWIIMSTGWCGEACHERFAQSALLHQGNPHCQTSLLPPVLPLYSSTALFSNRLFSPVILHLFPLASTLSSFCFFPLFISSWMSGWTDFYF